MKNIYMIFSATDLKIGKMIRFVTKNRYNHCSISLRDDLSKFYSFSRVYYKNPLIGGFVVESPCRYTLSSETALKIVTIEVTDDTYERVKSLVHYMRDHGDEFVYNYFSAAGYPFGMVFKRRNAFTCAEFVNSVLTAAGIRMPVQANIYQMEQALKNYPSIEGPAVSILKNTAWGEDKYLESVSKRRQAWQMTVRLGRLVFGRT